MQNIEPYGLYIISDQYFSDFPNDRYMENKGEARPPHLAVLRSLLNGKGFPLFQVPTYGMGSPLFLVPTVRHGLSA